MSFDNWHIFYHDCVQLFCWQVVVLRQERNMEKIENVGPAEIGVA
jgi:hypothetical protein